jgi:hypothetical protein
MQTKNNTNMYHYVCFVLTILIIKIWVFAKRPKLFLFLPTFRVSFPYFSRIIFKKGATETVQTMYEYFPEIKKKIYYFADENGCFSILQKIIIRKKTASCIACFDICTLEKEKKHLYLFIDTYTKSSFCLDRQSQFMWDATVIQTPQYFCKQYFFVFFIK